MVIEKSSFHTAGVAFDKYQESKIRPYGSKDNGMAYQYCLPAT